MWSNYPLKATHPVSPFFLNLDGKDDEMKEEIWKDVVGAEGRYLISDKGRVLSLGNNLDGRKRQKIILKFNIHPDGHKLVGIRYKQGDKVVKAKVHRLVMEAFLGPSKLIVDHIDRDPRNNNLENLRYTTQRVNMHNTKRARGYPCITEKCGAYRAIKYFDGKDICLGTYSDGCEANRVAVACDTKEKALIARSYIVGKRRNSEDVLGLLEKIS